MIIVGFISAQGMGDVLLRESTLMLKHIYTGFGQRLFQEGPCLFQQSYVPDHIPYVLQQHDSIVQLLLFPFQNAWGIMK